MEVTVKDLDYIFPAELIDYAYRDYTVNNCDRKSCNNCKFREFVNNHNAIIKDENARNEIYITGTETVRGYDFVSTTIFL